MVTKGSDGCKASKLPTKRAHAKPRNKLENEDMNKTPPLRVRSNQYKSNLLRGAKFQ